MLPQKNNIKTALTVAACVLLLLLLAVFGLWWDSRQEDTTVSAGSAFLMDTFIDQKMMGKNSAEAVQAVEASLSDFEKRVSAFLDSSEITRINQMAGIDYVAVSEETFSLIKTAKEYGELSGGLFDITIGPLADLWDFMADNPRVPGEDEIRSALELVDYRDILLNEEDCLVMLRRPGQKLNLGGMAKGAAGSAAMEAARDAGVKSGFLSVGGNIFTMGKKADGSAYRFGVRDPRGSGAEYVGIVDLVDTTMATSGDYERFFMADSVRYHHILDPQTGYPGQGEIISVSVICEDGAMADFLSTALFLAGKEAALSCGDEPSFDFILIDREKNVYITKGIVPYFTPNEEAVGYTFIELAE